jgi:hypothetical protein
LFFFTHKTNIIIYPIGLIERRMSSSLGPNAPQYGFGGEIGTSCLVGMCFWENGSRTLSFSFNSFFSGNAEKELAPPSLGAFEPYLSLVHFDK